MKGQAERLAWGLRERNRRHNERRVNGEGRGAGGDGRVASGEWRGGAEERRDFIPQTAWDEAEVSIGRNDGGRKTGGASLRPYAGEEGGFARGGETCVP